MPAQMNEAMSGRARCRATRSAFACALVAVAAISLPRPADAAPGDLDPTFSRDGLVTAEGVPGPAVDLAVQPDGKILVLLGCADDPEPREQFVLRRYLADGSLDVSFGRGGTAASAFDRRACAESLAVHEDGRIAVTGGVAPTTFETELAVAMFAPNGTADAGFGDGGQRVFADRDAGGDVSFDSGGRILLAAGEVLRLLPSGELDPSFSGDGAANITEFAASELVLLPDGAIIAGGFWSDGSLRVVRIGPGGEWEADFGVRGLSEPARFGEQDTLAELIVQGDGAILLAGASYTTFRPSSSAHLVRYTADGFLDPSFGSDGMVSDSGAFFDVGLAPGGGVFVTGLQTVPWRERNFYAAQLLPDGSLDQRFGDDGRIATDFEGHVDQSAALALPPGGALVLAGSAATRANPDVEGGPYVPDELLYPRDLGLARYELGAGKADLDGDGMQNRRDRCPAKWAAAASGCPKHRRSLVLEHIARKRLLEGTLSSPEVACVRGLEQERPGRRPEVLEHRVVIFERLPGADRKVGALLINAFDAGRFEERAPEGSGTYYAIVRAKANAATGTCRRAESRPVHVR